MPVSFIILIHTRCYTFRMLHCSRLVSPQPAINRLISHFDKFSTNYASHYFRKYYKFNRLWLGLRQVVNIAAELFLRRSRDRGGVKIAVGLLLRR